MGEREVVAVNCRVTLTGFEPDGSEECFEIVPDGKADVSSNRIGESSPLAQALVGASAGESVAYVPPKGEVTLSIQSVSSL